ncbi:tyrosine-type recombinase/integrase [Vibrio parahaemolyticus]|nr:tyrosine-type recombinase/integrase [Vibrio parahaemolyticus]
MFSLLYGSGLRVNECLRLRVQDLDLTNLSLTVRDGKGKKRSSDFT